MLKFLLKLSQKLSFLKKGGGNLKKKKYFEIFFLQKILYKKIN